MFKFLKEKLSKALDVFKEKAKEEIEEPKEEIKEEVKEKAKVKTEKKVKEKKKEDLKMDIVNVPIKRNEVSEIVERTLRKSLEDLLNFEEFNLVEKIKNNDEKPFVIVFFGLNGSGKTTTIAKVANLLKNQGLSCVLVAGDTWRKAAIEQIEDWADKLNIKLIKGQYGADPAAIGFDAVAYAKKNKIDVVLMDTAGRQQ